MNEQSRINAMISYFFLGPLFLLAKSGTPLRDPYVRSHAFRASIIMGMTLSIYVFYIFLIHPIFDFTLLGIDIHSIILSLISGLTMLFLLQGAYQAYHGKSAEYESSLTLGNIFQGGSSTISIENEDDKVRVVASMIPFLGIYIARKYPHPLIVRGRVIGSTIASLIIFSSLFSSAGGFLLDFVIILCVLFILAITVNLFIRGELIVSQIVESIPTYDEIEAHFFASIGFFGECSRIVFGGAGRETYHTLYVREISRKSDPIIPNHEYFMPPSLIGLPIWNILCIPSLWIEKYSEFRIFIIAGLSITVLGGLTVLVSGSGSPYLAFLLFPIVHMMTYARYDLGTYIPGIHIIMRVCGTLYQSRQKIQEHARDANINFSYPPKDRESSIQ